MFQNTYTRYSETSENLGKLATRRLVQFRTDWSSIFRILASLHRWSCSSPGTLVQRNEVESLQFYFTGRIRYSWYSHGLHVVKWSPPISKFRQDVQETNPEMMKGAWTCSEPSNRLISVAWYCFGKVELQLISWYPDLYLRHSGAHWITTGKRIRRPTAGVKLGYCWTRGPKCSDDSSKISCVRTNRSGPRTEPWVIGMGTVSE